MLARAGTVRAATVRVACAAPRRTARISPPIANGITLSNRATTLSERQVNASRMWRVGRNTEISGQDAAFARNAPSAGRCPVTAAAPSAGRRRASRGAGLRPWKHLRHNDVVKTMGLDGTGSGTQRGAGFRAVPAQPGSERGTRARIARLILENGPVTAAGLSTRLNLTPAAVRRHLDNLLADGMIETRTARRPASRGRGRPAKLFAITDVGRSAFEHAYDDLATSALRFLAEVAGPGAVAEFARRQVADLERRYGPVVQGAAPADRVAALAEALSADGYAASASGAPGPGTGPARRQHRHAGPRPRRRARRTALPASLPGGARGRRVPAAVRGGDGSVRPSPRHPGAAAGHHRARRWDLHHARHRTNAPDQHTPHHSMTAPQIGGISV